MTSMLKEQFSAKTEQLAEDTGPTDVRQQTVSHTTGVSYMYLPQPIIRQSQDLCQQLLSALQYASHRENRPVLVDQASQTDDTGTECDQMLRLENDKLKFKIKELVEMNVRWQTLHVECQGQLSDLRCRLESVGQPMLINEQVNLAASVELTRQLHESQNEIQRLRSTVDSLRSQSDSAAEERDNTIRMLEMQLVIFREDFESERKDRERAQCQIAELSTQLLQSNLAHERAGHYSVGSVNLPPSTGREQNVRPITHYNESHWETDGADETDCVEEEHEQEHVETRQFSANDVSNELLQCPKCHRQFTIDRHLELIDHIDECRS